MIVPYAAIRNVLIQKELGEKRAHWMTALQEYDMEIKPAKIVRGQGLCQLTTQMTLNISTLIGNKKRLLLQVLLMHLKLRHLNGMITSNSFFIMGFLLKPLIPRNVEH